MENINQSIWLGFDSTVLFFHVWKMDNNCDILLNFIYVVVLDLFHIRFIVLKSPPNGRVFMQHDFFDKVSCNRTSFNS